MQNVQKYLHPLVLFRNVSHSFRKSEQWAYIGFLFQNRIHYISYSNAHVPQRFKGSFAFLLFMQVKNNFVAKILLLFGSIRI